MKTKLTYSVVFSLALTTLAQGANDNSVERGHSNAFPVQLLPSDYGHFQHHSSTVAEGYLRGLAAWTHSQGNFLVNRYQATILAEKGRNLSLVNDLLESEVREHKRERRAKRLVVKRLKSEAARAAKYANAYQLSSAELDRESGTIRWPQVLKDARYRSCRNRLEELFERSARFDGTSSHVASDIERESNTAIRELNRHRGEISPQDFADTHRFLRGLKYESLFRSQVF